MKVWVNRSVTCAATQKMRYASKEEAHGAAVQRVNRGTDGRPLAVYECSECGGWHHTSCLDGKNGENPIAAKRQKEVALVRVERALQLIVDAEAVALTALYEYPKGDVRRVLGVVSEAVEEVSELVQALDRDELESPELLAALELLRPKLRALEILAREKEP